MDETMGTTLRGKTAIVSGVGAGLGIEIVRGLALAGANLVLGDIDPSGPVASRKPVESVECAACRPANRHSRPRRLRGPGRPGRSDVRSDRYPDQRCLSGGGAGLVRGCGYGGMAGGRRRQSVGHAEYDQGGAAGAESLQGRSDRQYQHPWQRGAGPGFRRLHLVQGGAGAPDPPSGARVRSLWDTGQRRPPRADGCRAEAGFPGGASRLTGRHRRKPWMRLPSRRRPLDIWRAHRMSPRR